jgi:hypothetical protein
VHTGEDLDQRRLAGAILAEEGDHFAAAHGHADVVESLRTTEAFAQAIDPQHFELRALGRLVNTAPRAIACHRGAPPRLQTTSSQRIWVVFVIIVHRASCVATALNFARAKDGSRKTVH